MKRRPTRIILGYRGKNYKFMSFFVDEKDNSFYFHIYRKANESPMKLKTPSSDQSSIDRIHFPDFEPTGFKENHVSFHESGYIHSTDNKGSRYRDGIVGVPFSKIESYLFILVVAPKNPLDMIELSMVDSSRDIQIYLPDDIRPFTLHFGLHRKESPLLSTSLPNNLLPGIIVGQFADKDFKLLIAMTKVGKLPGVEKVDWPPFTVVLKRTG